ncbi:hypothetical protein [Glutamicibacter ardleyensis]|uniref:Lipoprotein n=1 Tax=Glutamicibacter ardleyensis TaxID=225894 RepID=A0ABQ2DPE1_9MICC|nr:hypothetical protein [Glutamicibacter ardleyensis]GGJ66959.1 hypothetical protein GCM10007173_27300 [Glutamicibacter ardleyensis]
MFVSKKFWFVALWSVMTLGCLFMAVSGMATEAPALAIAGMSGFAAIGASISAYVQQQKQNRKALA